MINIKSENQNSPKKTKSIKIPFLAILIIAVLFTNLLCYLYIEFLVENDKKNFHSQIDNVFSGQKDVYDYISTSISNEHGFEDINDVYMDGVFNPSRKGASKEIKGIKDYFKLKSLGWKILWLRELWEDRYVITIYSADDMGYFSSETKRDAYFSGNVYHPPYIRTSIKDVYDLQLEQLIADNQDQFYNRGVYSNINDISSILTDYHYIQFYGESEYAKIGGYQTDEYRVWYKYKEEYYDIIFNKYLYNKNRLKYLILNTLITTILLLIIRYRKVIRIV